MSAQSGNSKQNIINLLKIQFKPLLQNISKSQIVGVKKVEIEHLSAQKCPLHLYFSETVGNFLPKKHRVFELRAK